MTVQVVCDSLAVTVSVAVHFLVEGDSLLLCCRKRVELGVENIYSIGVVLARLIATLLGELTCIVERSPRKVGADLLDLGDDWGLGHAGIRAYSSRVAEGADW